MPGVIEQLVRVQFALLLALLSVLTGARLVDSHQVSIGWEPPPLDHPTTIVLENGPTYTRLDVNKDYVIHLPQVAKIGATFIEGGRNVVLYGGHITVPDGGETDAERRGIYIKNATGVVHIEGILIDGTDPEGFDAIAISAPDAIVQIVNVRVIGVTGRFDGFHGDIIQPFGGVRELRVDHLTGTSNYQGIYLPETQGRVGAAIFRNVNLSYEPNVHDETTYLMWLPVNHRTCHLTYPVTMENVYIEPRSWQSAARSAVWPNSAVPQGCVAVQEGQQITWPSLDGLSGGVLVGSPPDGDFVPEAAVGVKYLHHEDS